MALKVFKNICFLIRLHHSFISKRPPEMLTDESPLFITPKPPKIWDADQKVWFINSPMGINTIGQLVPKALTKCGYDVSQSHITPTSLRKSMVGGAIDGGVVPDYVSALAGHGSKASRSSYMKPGIKQQAAMSHVISRKAGGLQIGPDEYNKEIKKIDKTEEERRSKLKSSRGHSPLREKINPYIQKVL